MDVLIYLPKVLLVLSIFTLPLIIRRASKTAVLITSTALTQTIWGAINLESPLQPLFGLWTLTPFIFGLWVAQIINFSDLEKTFLALFLVCSIGILFDTIITYPWSGQELELLGQRVEASRQWTTFGFERYAGFSRSSFNAASQLLVFGTLLVVLREKPLSNFLIWLFTGICIGLTTTKGAMAAWLVLTVYFSTASILKYQKLIHQLWLVFLGCILLILITLPLSTLFFNYEAHSAGEGWQVLFSSFGDRLTWMWPDSLGLLDSSSTWGWLTGRGIGGIGAAQRYFEPSYYYPADNLFVFLTVTFGIYISLLFIVLFFAKASQSPPRLHLALPFSLIIATYGLVINILEEPVLSFILGFILSASRFYTANHLIRTARREAHYELSKKQCDVNNYFSLTSKRPSNGYTSNH